MAMYLDSVYGRKQLVDYQTHLNRTRHPMFPIRPGLATPAEEDRAPSLGKLVEAMAMPLEVNSLLPLQEMLVHVDSLMPNVSICVQTTVVIVAANLDTTPISVRLMVTLTPIRRRSYKGITSILIEHVNQHALITLSLRLIPQLIRVLSFVSSSNGQLC
jgi:hypothetical protein